MLGAGWHNLPVIEMLEKDLKDHRRVEHSGASLGDEENSPPERTGRRLRPVVGGDAMKAGFGFRVLRLGLMLGWLVDPCADSYSGCLPVG